MVMVATNARRARGYSGGRQDPRRGDGGTVRPMLKEPVRIFLSYAPEDAVLAGELKKHLVHLERMHELILWDDERVQAGEDRKEVHRRELASAQLILLLVSSG